MTDKHRPERPAIDFGKGSREQTLSGAPPKATVYRLEDARRGPTEKPRGIA
jgi:hypothetical protein